jgi:hypothetical protein
VLVAIGTIVTPQLCGGWVEKDGVVTDKALTKLKRLVTAVALVKPLDEATLNDPPSADANNILEWRAWMADICTLPNRLNTDMINQLIETISDTLQPVNIRVGLAVKRVKELMNKDGEEICQGAVQTVDSDQRLTELVHGVIKMKQLPTELPSYDDMGLFEWKAFMSQVCHDATKLVDGDVTSIQTRIETGIGHHLATVATAYMANDKDGKKICGGAKDTVAVRDLLSDLALGLLEIQNTLPFTVDTSGSIPMVTTKMMGFQTSMAEVCKIPPKSVTTITNSMLGVGKMNEIIKEIVKAERTATYNAAVTAADDLIDDGVNPICEGLCLEGGTTDRAKAVLLQLVKFKMKLPEHAQLTLPLPSFTAVNNNDLPAWQYLMQPVCDEEIVLTSRHMTTILNKMRVEMMRPITGEVIVKLNAATRICGGAQTEVSQPTRPQDLVTLVQRMTSLGPLPTLAQFQALMNTICTNPPTQGEMNTLIDVIRYNARLQGYLLTQVEAVNQWQLAKPGAALANINGVPLMKRYTVPWSADCDHSKFAWSRQLNTVCTGDLNRQGGSNGITTGNIERYDTLDSHYHQQLTGFHIIVQCYYMIVVVVAVQYVGSPLRLHLLRSSMH